MPLTIHQTQEIRQLLLNKIRHKLSEYQPETNNMPFHTRLLGKDRMALYSFIQSINTTLGTSIFEQVAAIIAKPHFRRVINQYNEFGDQISRAAQITIQTILDDLTTARSKPDKLREISLILQSSQNGETVKVKPSRIDLFLENADGTEYFFDLKTAKPNIGDIVRFKRQLLEWVAIRGLHRSNLNIVTSLAIPYNPYEPQPYVRWTIQGMLDLPLELMVADEFWNFLGGTKTYDQLLDVFETAGLELRPEIDRKFSQL